MHTLETYTATYGSVFILHAVLAILSWMLLSPLGHVLSKLDKTPRAFSNHRMLMISSSVLTCMAFLIGVAFSSGETPLAHKLFGSALLLLVGLQVLGGVLRPDKGGDWRRAWKIVHGLGGASVMGFGGWLVHHSLVVFEVGGVVRIVVNCGLLLAASAVLTVHLMKWKEESKESSKSLQEHQEESDVELLNAEQGDDETQLR